ncbi:hypothetical protein WG922_07380 [Ramlibacter sp. AN1015]|uniref:hypothetical protein n=1 Tax=Ramlibacter sp. AN1015 TaxID=3133428 RepID=UPI0030BFBAFF
MTDTTGLSNGHPAKTRSATISLPLIISSTVAVLLGALTIYNGPSVIAAPTDVFILVNGAWRLTLGQIPHVDFHNPIGVLTYSLVELGMALEGPESLGLSWAGFLLLALAGPWASWAAYTRLDPWLACTFVMFVSLVCVATRPLGYDPTNHSYAMLYNRVGWVFLSILVLHAFFARVAAKPHEETLDAAALGVLLGLLFYTKITFALFGVAAVALALIARPLLRRPVALLAGGLGAALLITVIWILTGAAPIAYVADVAAAARVQSPELRGQQLVAAIKFAVVSLGPLTMGLLAVVGRRVLSERSLRPDIVWLTVQFGFLCAAGIAITAANTGERGEVPLYVLAGMLLISGRRVITDDRFRRKILWSTTAMTALIALFISGRDVYSILHTSAMRSYRTDLAPASQRIDAPPLRDFVVPHVSVHRTQFWRADNMPQKINEGLALLRAHVGQDARLIVFALSDLFSFPLRLEPPTGVPLWWDRNLSYDLKEYPPPEQVFADATHLMIPQLSADDGGCCSEVVTDLEQMYGRYLAAHFVEIARTDTWVLLRKSAPMDPVRRQLSTAVGSRKD